MKNRSHDSYDAKCARLKKAEALKTKMLDDVIMRLDALHKHALGPESKFTVFDLHEIDMARLNLQNVRSGWASRRKR